MGVSREGSNPHLEECEAAINYDTPFRGYLCWCLAQGDTGGVCSRNALGSALKLFLPGHAHVPDIAWIGGLQVLEVAPSLAQREVAVYGSANYVGVAVILAVVLPPAYLAQFLGLGHGQSLVPAAEASGRSRFSHPLSMRRFGRNSEGSGTGPDYGGNDAYGPATSGVNNASRTFQATDWPGRSVTIPVSIPFHSLPNGST